MRALYGQLSGTVVLYLGPVDSDDDDDSDAPVSGQLPDMSTVQRHSAEAKLTVHERTVNVNERVMPTHAHEEAPADDAVMEAQSAEDAAARRRRRKLYPLEDVSIMD